MGNPVPITEQPTAIRPIALSRVLQVVAIRFVLDFKAKLSRIATATMSPIAAMGTAT